MGRRVLLTGATGFVGQWLPAQLIEEGCEVHIFGRSQERQKLIPGANRCVWHMADFLSTENWEREVRSVCASHLIHLAWCPDQAAHLESQENLDWVNASMRLVQAFEQGGGRRVVVGGSCAEYEWSNDGADLYEGRTPLKPASMYGKSKLLLFRALIEAKSDISWAWARIFVPFGPKDYPRRLVAYVIGNLLKGEPASCSEGLQSLDFIYVEDVASALRSLLWSPVTGAVNVASGEAHTVRQVVRYIADAIGRPDLVSFGGRDAGALNIRRLVADVVKLREEVGFLPAYNLEQGLDATIAWTRRTTA